VTLIETTGQTLFVMMDMSSARKYSSDRPSGGGSPRGNQSPYRPNRQSPRLPPSEPTLRSLAQERHSEDGLLPPPLPQVHHNRSSDSMSSQGSTASRRLCAKCGQPMADKFVRAMGKKFHLDCFRCYVLTPILVSRC
jgi:LIM domain